MQEHFGVGGIISRMPVTNVLRRARHGPVGLAVGFMPFLKNGRGNSSGFCDFQEVIVSVVENMKEVAELVKKFNDIELNRRILNLENEVLDLSRDKRRAEERIEDLERKLKFREQLTFKSPFYYRGTDPEPYCPGCWDSKRTAVHLHHTRKPLPIGDCMECPSCKHNYRTRTGI